MENLVDWLLKVIFEGLVKEAIRGYTSSSLTEEDNDFVRLKTWYLFIENMEILIQERK
jgi:hypothetical protein